MTEKTMTEITGIDLDYSNLPDVDLDRSMHPDAVKYRVALARASNAIEGVIMTDEEKAFMDSIPPDMPIEEFTKKIKEFYGT
ncbi:MAG: hypothetical protein ACWIPH_10095 [Ostreibacterium sp.]